MMILEVLFLWAAVMSACTEGYRQSGDAKQEEDYQGPPSPYAFEYNNQDENGTTLFRKESSDGKGKIQGTYGYRDAFGTERLVEYIADENGYRAQIRTNEPGTESRSPAGVQLMASPHRQAHEQKTLPLSSPEKPFPKKASEAAKLKQSFKHQEATSQESLGQFNTFISTKKQPQTQQQVFSQPPPQQSGQKWQGSTSPRPFNTFAQTQPKIQQHAFSQPQPDQTPHVGSQEPQDSSSQGPFSTFTSTKKQPQMQQQVFSQQPPLTSSQTPQSTIIRTQSQPLFGSDPFSRNPQVPSVFGQAPETRPAFIQPRPTLVQFQSRPREAPGVHFFGQQPSRNQHHNSHVVLSEPVRGHSFTAHIQHRPEPVAFGVQPVVRTHATQILHHPSKSTVHSSPASAFSN